MTSTTNKPFHTYENVAAYDDHPNHASHLYSPPSPPLALANINNNNNNHACAAANNSSNGGTSASSSNSNHHHLHHHNNNNIGSGGVCTSSSSNNNNTNNHNSSGSSSCHNSATQSGAAAAIITTTSAITAANNNSAATTTTTISTTATNSGSGLSGGVAINKAAIESPFTDTLHDPSNCIAPAATILSTTDSSGTTRMLTTSRAPPGQNLVTKLIALPAQSPMDSLREWSVNTFKCTKQMINEKRGVGSVTNDVQLQADIEQLRESRNRLVQMLKTAQQMNYHYRELVLTQRQLHGLMSEMSIKNQLTNLSSAQPPTGHASKQSQSNNARQMVANFSSLGNNLSSTTTTSPSTTTPKDAHSKSHLNDYSSIFNHIKSANVNLSEDFEKNAISMNATIKNGEKLVAVLTFFCSNLWTLINKTIEDTLLTVKSFESARLEYDAERNSVSFTSSSAQTSINYTSDKLEMARLRYEQLKEDVQVKMKFLEENTVKVIHKQLLMFNSAFASYSTGNTAALDATLRQYGIR